MGERFLLDILEKLRLNISSVDVFELTAAVEKRLSKAVRNLPESLEVKEILPCGSMVDGNRMWEYSYNRCGVRCHGFCGQPEIEFDYLAVLKASSTVTVEDSCFGYQSVRCKYSYERMCGIFCDTTEYTCSLCLRMGFREAVTKSLLEIPEEDNFYNGYNNRSHGVIAYHFLWEGCKSIVAPNYCNQSKPQHDMSSIKISVDFLPAFEIKQMCEVCLEQGYKTEPCNTCETNNHAHYYLVTKGCGRGRCKPKPCFLKSDRMVEIQMLKGTSQVHRDTYAVLKFLIPYVICYNDEDVSEGTPIKSFIVKTAILHHTRKCPYRNPSLIKCTMQTIELLIEAYTGQYLPNITSGKNLLHEGNDYTGTYQVHVHSFRWIQRVLEKLPAFTNNVYNFYETLKLFQAIRMVKTPCFLTYFLYIPVKDQINVLKQMETDVESGYDDIVSLTNKDIVKRYFDRV